MFIFLCVCSDNLTYWFISALSHTYIILSLIRNRCVYNSLFIILCSYKKKNFFYSDSSTSSRGSTKSWQSSESSGQLYQPSNPSTDFEKSGTTEPVLVFPASVYGNSPYVRLFCTVFFFTRIYFLLINYTSARWLLFPLRLNVNFLC